MAAINTSFTLSELLSSRGILDGLQRQIDGLRAVTVYHSPQTADTLIRWEFSEFDPYFVHEDF